MIYGLFKDISPETHNDSLIRALDVAVLLCENHCISPPGFPIECVFAREALRRRQIYLTEQLIQFPIRENSIGDYVEKKRREYAPYQKLYGGIYDDRSLTFLVEENAPLIKRDSEIGRAISDTWVEGPDRPAGLWTPLKAELLAREVEAIRLIPGQLVADGMAATWPAIEAHLPAAARRMSPDVRRLLQNTYFAQYVREYRLVVVRNLPWMLDDFGLAANDLTFDYRYFAHALSALGMKTLILNLQPESLVRLKRTYGFIELLDVYSDIGKRRTRQATMEILFNRAARVVGLDAEKLISTLTERGGRFDLPDHRLATLGDELSAVAGQIERMAPEYEATPSRPTQRRHGPRQEMSARATPVPGSIAVFLALESELNVLTKQLGLTRGPMQGPQASGLVGGVPIDIVCPYAMGRVSAAVAMMKYLQSRATDLPKLIVIGGLAGGFAQSEVRPGDIIVGTTVVDLATRKVIDAIEGTVTEFRRQDYPLTDAIALYLRSHGFDDAEWERAAIDEAEWPRGLRPTLHYGLITSVDEVVGSIQWQETLLKETPKLLGVEMEAGGVCAAGNVFRIPVALLRTVSDAADPAKKDDKWRTIGMKTLAVLLQRLNFPQILGHLGNA